MKQLTIKTLLLIPLIGAVLLTSGCESGSSDSDGSSDGGSESSSSDISSLVGDYILVGFTVLYDDGTVVTQDDVAGQYIGTMTIANDSSVVISITILGVPAVQRGRISDITSTALTVNDTGSDRSYSTAYLLDGNILTFTEYEDNGYQETDVWQRL